MKKERLKKEHALDQVRGAKGYSNQTLEGARKDGKKEDQGGKKGCHLRIAKRRGRVLNFHDGGLPGKNLDEKKNRWKRMDNSLTAKTGSPEEK